MDAELTPEALAAIRAEWVNNPNPPLMRTDYRSVIGWLFAHLDALDAELVQEREKTTTLRASITRALDGCPFCKTGHCRADAHIWLAEARAATAEVVDEQ